MDPTTVRDIGAACSHRGRRRRIGRPAGVDRGGTAALACGSMRAVQIREFGGPEVLELVDLPDPEPGEGEVLVDVARAGINFADTHKRHNTYVQKTDAEMLPLIP